MPTGPGRPYCFPLPAARACLRLSPARSPDNLRFAYSILHTATGLSDIVSANANGTDSVIMATRLKSPSASWDFPPTKVTGGSKPFRGKAAPSSFEVELGAVTITYSDVSMEGATIVLPISPNATGTAPDGFIIGETGFEVITTAQFTPPITVCLTVPESEVPQRRRFSPRSRSWLTRMASWSIARPAATLPPVRYAPRASDAVGAFALAEHVDPGMGSITGLGHRFKCTPLPDVSVQLTGTEERLAQTDSDGRFQFVNLTAGNYNVQPTAFGFTFTEPNEIFIDVTGEETVVFTGTEGSFTIAGNVSDQDGHPMVGVEMILDEVGSTMTDSNGNYTFQIYRRRVRIS